MKSIENNVFWITGASSGIGRSIAELVIAKGAKVVASGRNQVALESLQLQYPDFHNNIFPLAFDLGADFDAEDLVKQVVNRFGRIDFLINNGGISQRSLTAETPLEVDRKIMETNFFGNIKIAKAVLPLMIQQGGGHIAVTSSVVGKFGFPLRSAYAASKHALHGFYESLRAENFEQNIRVTMIIPGRINTDISVNAMTAEGKKHGILDPGQATGMTSEKAAQLILKGILNHRKEIIVGKFDTIMVHIRRFLPRLFYYMARKIDPK
ncbi:MAG: SDR family oxidoreductase [Bacteroidales bacterium]|nr:SDR family oxidoreductase [Bacteroidales bacterium]